MDRTNLAAYAVAFLPLTATLCTGCGSPAAPPTVAAVEEAPRKLDMDTTGELPSRRLSDAPVTRTTAIEKIPHLSTAEDEMPSADLPTEAPAEEAPAIAAEAVKQTEAVIAADPAAPAAPAPVAAETATPDAAATVADEEPARTNTQLPWAGPVSRSPEMLAVLQRADGLVRHGFQLAERGALYSSRAEFIAALQVIVQANDSQHGTRVYTKALGAGLTALKESGDFVRQQAGGAEVDVARKVTGHKTPILRNGGADQYSAMQAAQRYYTYAQEQLAFAAGGETVGSMALFGLGKGAMAASGGPHSQRLEQVAEGMVLYQASLMADPNNFRAANELAVLLAQSGNMARARELLIRSVAISPQVVTWQNLAAVHAYFGERDLAEQAQAQAVALQQLIGTTSGPAVQWLDPETFAQMSPQTDQVMPAVPSAAPAAPPAQAPAAAKSTPNVAKKGKFDWLPRSPLR